MIKTDAINLCLRYIGEAPLPSGTTLESLDPQHEAVVIDKILEEVSVKLQSDGWWFNQDDWELSPDSTTGKINVPFNALGLETDNDYLVRGGVLYNRTNKTFTFTDKVSASIVWKLPFSNLPQTFAFYVSYLAAQEAQVLFNGDSFVDKDLLKHIADAYVKVQREQVRRGNYNLASGSRIISRTSNPTGIS